MVSHTFFGAIALHGLVTFALAGNANIVNKCSGEIFVQTVPINGDAGAVTSVGTGGTFSQGIEASGAAIKISTSNPPTGNSITQLEYATTDGTLFYSINLVDCATGEDGAQCPGWAGGLKLESSDGSCGSATCAAGSFCPNDAYFQAQDDAATKSCGDANADLTLTLCAETEQPPTKKRGIAGRIQI